jgi:hypothetical protein
MAEQCVAIKSTDDLKGPDRRGATGGDSQTEACRRQIGLTLAYSFAMSTACGSTSSDAVESGRGSDDQGLVTSLAAVA